MSISDRFKRVGATDILDTKTGKVIKTKDGTAVVGDNQGSKMKFIELELKDLEYYEDEEEKEDFHLDQLRRILGMGYVVIPFPQIDMGDLEMIKK